MSKVGVVLSGCGVYDGAEIHESVLTLLALDRSKVEAICMAPNIDQHHVINHLTGQVVEKESRNVLIESARIARGKIKDIKDVCAKDIDAIVFPGGFGAAKNLCNFAIKGANCTVNNEVERLVKEMADANKPIGLACIAPSIASKIFENSGKQVKLTIGTDKDTAKQLKTMGTEHIDCSVKEFVVDKENKIVTTPAYMLGQNISDVAEGIERWIKEIIKLI
ncbi:MAG: isoprenoid biosynthesis glyoxalase ElbB [Spirochaetota bacterium]|nr:isoprenoid biosynthesis glyoxalase ElbB [Spirochaetota bacterium]